MSDDRSNKRLKKEQPDASGVDASDARDVRIDALEHENAHIRQQLLRSDAEVARQQQLQVNHGALADNTFEVVNFSRLDTSLVTHIVSFVGTSRELINLALTCKSFGWNQPRLSGLEWSLTEEVARQAVQSGRNDIEGARITLPQYTRGTTTWLSILRESEHPLKFDTLLGRCIGHANEDKSSVRCRNSESLSTAVANNYVMVSGIHYTEFYIYAGLNAAHYYIGIVRPMPNLDPARFANDSFTFFKPSLRDDFLVGRTEEWGSGNVHVCYYSTYAGRMGWTNWDDDENYDLVWEGAEGSDTGDTVGMLLNLNEGTLAVYKNNRRLGVMKDGLSGSYCWCATIPGGEVVAIRKGKAPKA